jgi:LacI family transcriptional regulator
MAMKRVTIDDVARRAQVSKATVSAVLNHKNVVRPETREQILKAISDLQYRPRPSARVLRSLATERGSIQLLIRELDNPFYSTLALGVMQRASELGYLVVITSSEGSHAREEEITRVFSHREIKGAIIAPVLQGTAEIDHLFRLKMINFPFVLLENVPGIQANVVAIDNIGAMLDAMRYLINIGHTRIVHFAGPDHASHADERIQGFKRAYMESSLAFTEELIVPTGAHLESGYETSLAYFANRPTDEYPSAIVCYNDLVAIGVMSALQRLMIPVPTVVSVIGSDDIPLAEHLPVRLTTIRAPMLDLGRKAAEILIRNIEAQTPLPLENVVLDASLVVRESTMAIPSLVGAQSR